MSEDDQDHTCWSEFSEIFARFVGKRQGGRLLCAPPAFTCAYGAPCVAHNTPC